MAGDRAGNGRGSDSEIISPADMAGEILRGSGSGADLSVVCVQPLGCDDILKRRAGHLIEKDIAYDWMSLSVHIVVCSYQSQRGAGLKGDLEQVNVNLGEDRITIQVVVVAVVEVGAWARGKSWTLLFDQAEETLKRKRKGK